jgi:hypothetical protein
MREIESQGLIPVARQDNDNSNSGSGSGMSIGKAVSHKKEGSVTGKTSKIFIAGLVLAGAGKCVAVS